MQQIDEPRLETDLAYRFDYLTRFMGFGEDDVRAIHNAAEILAPLVPALVDAVYAKLYAQDATWRHFLPRQHGYDGATPDDLAALSPDHPQIAFRKAHLARYLERLVTKPYDAKMVQYLDMVGRIHTAHAGNPDIVVPLVQMNALLGFVHDAINAALFEASLPNALRAEVVRAFSKLLWLQNDLINRHYAAR